MSAPTPRPWRIPPDPMYDLQDGADRVIVMKPKAGDTKVKELVMDDTKFFTKYSKDSFPANFSPRATHDEPARGVSDIRR